MGSGPFAALAGKGVRVAVNYDPIDSGYVASLSHPEANITGVILRSLEIIPKQLQILRELVADADRLAILWDEYTADEFAAAEQAAKLLSLQIHSAELKLETRVAERKDASGDIDAAFQQLAQSSPQMLLVLSSGRFQLHRDQIAALALRYNMPSMFKFPDYVRAGGLASYGVNRMAIYRQAADDIAKILSGTNPADIPIERVDRFEVVFNLKTAKALGLTIPRSMLALADEVIE